MASLLEINLHFLPVALTKLFDHTQKYGLDINPDKKYTPLNFLLFPLALTIKAKTVAFCFFLAMLH